MPSLKAIITGDGSQLKREFSAIEIASHHLGNEMRSAIGGNIGRIASAAGIEELVRHTVEYAESVSILAQRLGISTDAVQKWDYALKLNGTSLEASKGFFEKLATARKKALEGTDEFAAAFKRLGVAASDLQGSRLEDLALKIAQAFEAGDPQKLIADLKEVGGKGAGELVAAFRVGMTELMDQAPVIGNKVIESLRDAADRSKSVWQEFVAGIAPALDFVAKNFEAWWRFTNIALNQFIGGNEQAAEVARKYFEQDEAAERRREARKRPLVGGGEEEDDKSAKHEMDEEARLGERLLKLKEENQLKALKPKQRLEELKQLKANAEELAATPFLTQIEKLRAGISAQEYQKQIEEMGKDKPRAVHGHLTSLQQVGGFAANAVIVDVAHKQLHTQRQILAHIQKGGGFGDLGRVQH